MKYLLTNTYFKLYCLSSLIYIAFAISQEGSSIERLYLIFPLSITSLIFILHSLNLQNLNRLFAYFLFFSISFTSLLGITNILDGSYASTSDPIFYGLAFYTAFCAFHIFEKKFTYNFIWVAANPLLLITGPIAFIFKRNNYKKLTSRINYYLPFFLVGLFFFKIIATPLTAFFSMIDLTNALDVIAFGFI